MLGIDGNIDASANIVNEGLIFTEYSESQNTEDLESYDTLSAEDSDMYIQYGFTTAKRQVRSNMRRKTQSNSQGSVLYNTYKISVIKHNNLYQHKNSEPSSLMHKDYIVLLRHFVI